MVIARNVNGDGGHSADLTECGKRQIPMNNAKRMIVKLQFRIKSDDNKKFDTGSL